MSDEDQKVNPEVELKPLDNNVQSPLILHTDPVMHVTRDVDGLPIPHPGEQPRHVIERALAKAQDYNDAVNTPDANPGVEIVEPEHNPDTEHNHEQEG